MSGNDMWCSRCKSHHHSADCQLDEKEIINTMQIKDDTIDEIVNILSHYIRSLYATKKFSNEWINRVYKLRDKLIEMGNDKLLGGGK